MKGVIIVAFLCVTCITAYAQEGLIRWDENKQLQWDDFTGKVNDSSHYDAECYAEVRYEYKFYDLNDFEFNVYASFDKSNSWSRKEKQSQTLLQHEQTHFNIAQLFAAKLKDDFESFNYTANYDGQITQLFNQGKLQYQSMQRQYDDETNHSLNKEKQKEWEDFIDGELRKTRLKFQLAESTKKPSKEGS